MLVLFYKDREATGRPPQGLFNVAVHPPRKEDSALKMSVIVKLVTNVWQAFPANNHYLRISEIHLRISVIHLRISVIHLRISEIHLWISEIHLRISVNNFGYPKFTFQYPKIR